MDGIVFDSAKEANRYKELKLLERAGHIKSLRLQVPFIFEIGGKRCLRTMRILPTYQKIIVAALKT